MVYLYDPNSNLTPAKSRGHLRHSNILTAREISPYTYHSEGLVSFRADLDMVASGFAEAWEYSPGLFMLVGKYRLTHINRKVTFEVFYISLNNKYYFSISAVSVVFVENNFYLFH
jgi:hypothetical protein